MRRSEAETIKAFLSRSEDELRAPYARQTVLWPRSCSFMITTNDPVFLSDPSGGRRFWPIEVPKTIDFDGLADARDQLLAEALVRWKDGATWWPRSEENHALADAQEDLQFIDPWEVPIADFCLGKTIVEIAHVRSDAVRVTDLSRWGPRDDARIVACLRRLGFKRKQIGGRGNRKWAYVRE
jgi:predicted P-loop ATPase